MAIDLRLQKFAFDIFLQLERRIDIQDLLLSRSREYEDVSENDCTREIVDLIFSRYYFFGNKLMELKKDFHLYKNNDVEFYIYLRENMSRYFPYPIMNVFDKLSMSCAVVLKMSHLLNLNAMYRDTTPISWAMYFEAEMIEEFYANDGWKLFGKYAETKATDQIIKWPRFTVSTETFRTDLRRADKLYQESKDIYCYDGIFESFKKCIKEPGIPCCPECLPLFDILYSLSFSRNLVTEFQLLEGYFQMFLRMWFVTKTTDMYEYRAQSSRTRIDNIDKTSALMKTRCTVTNLFHKRIFMITTLKSKGELVLNSCVFCGKDKKVRSVAYLKSIIHRTVSTTEFDFPSKYVKVNKKANGKLISNELEDNKTLRLFLTLGESTNLNQA